MCLHVLCIGFSVHILAECGEKVGVVDVWVLGGEIIFVIIPVKCESHTSLPIPVDGDCVVLLED